MSQPYQITIAGIGGVGGYYGGLLSQAYAHATDVQVNFLARGGHMQAIRNDGLQLLREEGAITVYPHRVADNPSLLPSPDLIIFCCKAYDLEALAFSFAGYITDSTVMLPLLNGVDSKDVLQAIFPNNKVLYGCTYLVSALTGEGSVTVTGAMNQLLFGNPDMNAGDLARIETVLKAMNANVQLHPDIRQKVWEKFSFISPMATATSFFDSSVDQILNNDERNSILNALMREIASLASYEGVQLPEDIFDLNRAKLEKLPAGATSSLHKDFRNNKRTELETLTGYVLRRAGTHGVVLPTYRRLYNELSAAT